MPKKKRRRKLPNGVGSITYLKGRDSPWWARRSSITLPDGSQYRKSIGYFKTYEQAYQSLMSYTNLNSEKVTLLEVFNRVKDSLKFQNISPATQDRYIRDFKMLGELRYEPIQAINYTMLQGKIDEIQKNGYIKNNKVYPYSLDKMKKTKSMLNKIYSRAIKDNLVETNLADLIEIEGIQESKQFNIFTIKEIKKMFELCKTYKNLRYPLVHMFFGFRTIEMTRFRKKHIDFEKNIVQGMGSKTEKGRTGHIIIIPIIKPLLLELYNETDDYILGKKVSTDYYRKFIFYKALDEVNMRNGRTPYDCRDTFAYLLNHFKVELDVIRDMMRHEDASTTLNHYIPQDMEKASKELSKITL